MEVKTLISYKFEQQGPRPRGLWPLGGLKIKQKYFASTECRTVYTIIINLPKLKWKFDFFAELPIKAKLFTQMAIR